MLDFIRKTDFWEAMDAKLDQEIPGKLSFQLKTIQDLWVYSQICNESGKKIAEIGCGESRILPTMAQNNECFNIEKFEGADNGPSREIVIPSVENIKAFVGDFSSLIPDNTFDVLFSVSVVEHIEDKNFDSFFEDCIRILRPGGYMIHAIDIYVADEPLGYFSNRFEMYRNAVVDTAMVEPISKVIQGPLKHSTDMASNPDQIMYGWKAIAPALDEIRQNSQNVSITMGAKKLA